MLAFHVWLFTEAHTVAHREQASDFVFANLGLGLYLFFALSGFLLYRPFVKAAARGVPMPGLATYLRNRVARIAPAYYVSIAGALALLWTGATGAGTHLPPADKLWLFAVFGQNFSSDTMLTLNPSTWSLVVEAGFYLLVPLVGWTIAMRTTLFGRPLSPNQRAVAAPLVLAAAGVGWNAQTIDAEAVVRLALPAMLPYFACGMLAAVAAERVSMTRLAAAATATVGVGWVFADVLIHERYADAMATAIARNLLATVGFGLIIAAVSCRRAASKRGKVAAAATEPAGTYIADRVATIVPPLPQNLLGSRPLVSLGTISYGIYLWHVPLILWARAEGLLAANIYLALTSIAAASIVLATASWFLVERPAINWAQRRSARSRRLTAAPVVTALRRLGDQRPGRLQSDDQAA